MVLLSLPENRYAALDLQAQAATRAAERKADLLRRAAAYDNEGLATGAADLR